MTIAKPPVIFRTDGHTTMGLGHLFRSAALAEMLRPAYNCYLAFRYCPPSLLSDWVGAVYRDTIDLGSTEMSDEPGVLVEAIADRGWEEVTLVLDGYHFDYAYQLRLRKPPARKVVCIDDLHTEKFCADLIVNHTPGIRAANYRANPEVGYALGLRFALLRSPFLHSGAGPTVATGSSSSLFVSLGGADPNNDTLRVLRHIREHTGSGAVTVDVVTGPAYRHVDSVREYVSAHPRLTVRLHHSLGAVAMAALMRKAGAAITSPSTVALEYLATGGRLYLCQTADNQAHLYRNLLVAGWAQDYTYWSPPSPVSDKLPQLPAIDGRQPGRFRKLFATLGLTYRPAGERDADLYFEWVNDPVVRAQSINSSTVAYSDHVRWFSGKLSDPATVMLLFQREGTPVGQVRLELRGQEEALLNYSVAAVARGGGLGFSMLLYAENYLQRHHPSVHRLVGMVKEQNFASMATFRNLGYREAPTEGGGLIKFVLHGV